jgi:hypothetical protein
MYTQADERKFISLLRHTAWPLAGALLLAGWLAIAPRDHLAAYVPAEAVAYVHLRKPLPPIVTELIPDLNEEPAQEIGVFAVLRDDGTLSWTPLLWEDRVVLTTDYTPATLPAKSLATAALSPWRFHFPVTGVLTQEAARHVPEAVPFALPDAPLYFGAQQTSRGISAAFSSAPTHRSGVATFLKNLLTPRPATDTGLTSYGTLRTMPMLRMLLPEWFIAADTNGLSSTPDFAASIDGLTEALGSLPATSLDNDNERMLLLGTSNHALVIDMLATAFGSIPQSTPLRLPDGKVVEQFTLPASPTSLPTIQEGNLTTLHLPDVGTVSTTITLTQCPKGVVLRTVPHTHAECPRIASSHYGRGVRMRMPESARQVFPQLEKFSTVSIDQIVDNFVTILIQ